MSKIKGLSAENVSDAWSMSYCPNMGCAVLLHDIDVDGEWVTAQYHVSGYQDVPDEATPVKRYKIMRRKIDRDMYGESYDPNGNGTHEYIRINGMSVALDEFMWRGGNIVECQKILIANGTIKVG